MTHFGRGLPQNGFHSSNKVYAMETPIIVNLHCNSSQLKYVFRLEENMSRAVSQNSLTPQGKNNMNIRLARDQVVLLETAANL